MRLFLLLNTLLFTIQVHAVNLFAGKLDQYSPFPSQYFDNKDVHVWLPEGYSDAKKYAVLYMHDGQHLMLA